MGNSNPRYMRSRLRMISVMVILSKRCDWILGLLLKAKTSLSQSCASVIGLKTHCCTDQSIRPQRFVCHQCTSTSTLIRLPDVPAQTLSRNLICAPQGSRYAHRPTPGNPPLWSPAYILSHTTCCAGLCAGFGLAHNGPSVISRPEKRRCPIPRVLRGRT